MTGNPSVKARIALWTTALGIVLLMVVVLGVLTGAAGGPLRIAGSWIETGSIDPMLKTIILEIRLPRVLIAALAGATLSLGGLVFQVLLRNPLAEPYILGVSGGGAVGAITGILLGLSRFPGVSLTAFAGSTATLLVIVAISSGRRIINKESLLLSGVMVNAFCGAVILFLVSLVQDARLHTIMFWLMGDLSLAERGQTMLLALVALPCFLLLWILSNKMNLLLMGEETAKSAGVPVRAVTLLLLGATSLMVSATVCQSGLIGFVGLVIPHVLRLSAGPDNRVLVPACVLGGGAYMVLCDVLARVLPEQGELPVGVITALVGAPLFILLLRRSHK
ncbi:MAG TPA: iron ABC transporter permease [Desulfobacteraceae bacterium]|nr:iron ABC transporter permease [Desulfobacteraceae bacterium]